MKITNLTVTPVNIPLETPFLWTGGHYPGTSKAIVEVETDEGLTGGFPHHTACAILSMTPPKRRMAGVASSDQLAAFSRMKLR